MYSPFTPTSVGRRLAVVLLVVLLVAAVPAASAQPLRGSDSVTIPAGTVASGDISVVGGTVTIAGTLDGSLDGPATSVTVTETGVVTGDVDVAAGSVHVRGTVEGDVNGAAGVVTVAEGARIGGDLSAAAGSLVLDGAVDGSVRVGAEALTVGPTARVGGDLLYDAEDMDIAEGATVGGVTEFRPGLRDGRVPLVGDLSLAVGTSLALAVVGFVASLALGVVLLVAAPSLARRVTDTGRSHPARSGLVGVGTILAVPVSLVLLAVTVVGIPLSVAGLLVSIPLLWVAFVYGALLTGDWLVSFANVRSPYVALAVGLLVPTVVSTLPFGDLVAVAYLLVGLGALVLTLVERRRGGGDRTGARGATGEGTEADRGAGAPPAV